jgi:hypothetical protein
MANRRAGAKTEANLGRKKADLSLPPKTAKPVQTVKPPVRPKPVTPTPSNRPKTAKPVQTVTPVRPKPVTPTPSNRPSNRPTTPERPPTVVDEREYTKLRNASRIKAAMRDNPLPKVGNDLVKMNKGGKIRGYGMARGGKVCKMR